MGVWNPTPLQKAMFIRPRSTCALRSYMQQLKSKTEWIFTCIPWYISMQDQCLTQKATSLRWTVHSGIHSKDHLWNKLHVPPVVRVEYATYANSCLPHLLLPLLPEVTDKGIISLNELSEFKNRLRQNGKVIYSQSSANEWTTSTGLKFSISRAVNSERSPSPLILPAIQ